MKKHLSLILILLLTLCMLFVPSCDTVPAEETNSDNTTESSGTSEEATESETEETTDTPTESETEAPKSITLKIGSYNIANGREVSHDMKKIANDILSKELDIVGIQEVDRLASRSKFIDTMKLLSEYTGYQYYYYTKAINIAGNEATYGQKGEYGTGILSKYPITASESHKLESGKEEQRMLGYAEIDVNGTKINFFNTHLSFESLDLRTGQFNIIANLLKDKKNCILTGDFNISSFGEYNLLSFLSTTCNTQNNITTFPSSGKSIDNILFSSEFTLKSSGALANKNSDHYMLYAEFEFAVE